MVLGHNSYTYFGQNWREFCKCVYFHRLIQNSQERRTDDDEITWGSDELPIETINHEDSNKGKNFISKFFLLNSVGRKKVFKIIFSEYMDVLLHHMWTLLGSIHKVKSHRQTSTFIYVTRSLHSCRWKSSVAWSKTNK